MVCYTLHITHGDVVQVYPMFGFDKSNELRGRNVSTLIPVRGRNESTLIPVRGRNVSTLIPVTEGEECEHPDSGECSGLA